MDSSTVSKKRISPHTDYTHCIICQAPSQASLQILTEKGYQALVFAVEKRNDSVAHRLSEPVTNNTLLSYNPMYHAKCRNSYINRKTVELKFRKKLGKHAVVEEEPAQESSHVLTRRSTNTGHPMQLKEECFVCGKSRNKKGQRNLILVSTLDRQKSILSKAKELCDNNMLQFLQGHGDSCVDMIASGFRYHKLCLDTYLNKKPAEAQNLKPQNLYEVGFNWLVSFINNALSENNNRIFFSHKTSRYVQGLVGK